MCSKRKGYFAAVVEIMFDRAPDDRLAREARNFFALHILENLVQISGRPTNEGRLNHLPGSLKPRYQLARASWMRTAFVPLFQWSDLSTCFTKDQEIADTATNDMGNIFTYRAQMWSDA
jgi:hypothetical protein